MIEKLLALLERFVCAHERLAASQEALLQNCNCAAPVLTETPAPVPAPAEPTAKEEDSAPVATAASWNPFLEPPQGRYGKDKLAILDAEIATRGISLKASATGPEKHQALLDWSNAKKDELADVPADEPTPPAAPEEPAAPVEDVTVEMVRAMAQKAMTGKDKLAAGAVQDLFERHAGVRKLPEIPADKLAAVYAELAKTVGV